jgi:hypothetical protein
MRHSAKLFIYIALLFLSSCGLSPPEHIKLGGPSVLPTGDDCRGDYELKELSGTSIQLPAGGGIETKLTYAVMCGKEVNDRFIRNGLYVGWGNGGDFVVRGQFRRNKPSGTWSLFYPNGKPRASIKLQGTKVSDVGEYFDAKGAHDPAPAFLDAETLGTAAAFDTFLKRHPKAPQVNQARQRHAAARFKESGHFVSQRVSINSRGGGLAAYLELDKPPRKCKTDNWNPNKTETCTLASRTVKYRHGRRYTVPSNAFWKSLRGVAMRPAKCKKSSHYKYPYTCTMDPDDAPIRDGAKDGLWIDFPDAEAKEIAACEWGRYENGLRTGLWVRWDYCYRAFNPDNNVLSVSPQKNDWIYADWWSEDAMNEKIASITSPNKAYDYTNGVPTPVDPKKVMVAMGEFKLKKQRERVKTRVDSCLSKTPLLTFHEKRRNRRRRKKNSQVDPSTFTHDTRGSHIRIEQHIGVCARGKNATYTTLRNEYLATLCAQGTVRACYEVKWNGFERKTTPKFKKAANRIQFAEELSSICSSRSEFAGPACVRLKSYLKELYAKKDKRRNAAIKKANDLADKRPTDANYKKVEKLEEKRTQLMESRRGALREKSCAAGVVLHCLIEGNEAHRLDKHKKANSLFALGCKAGGKGMCDYDSKQVAQLEKQRAKEKAERDAKYTTRCTDLGDGDFECRKVLKGSARSQPSKQCNICRSRWYRQCRKKRLTGNFCENVVSSNCAAYCN